MSLSRADSAQHTDLARAVQNLSQERINDAKDRYHHRDDLNGIVHDEGLLHNMNHRLSQLAMGADEKLVGFAVLLLDVGNDLLLVRARIEPQIESVKVRSISTLPTSEE